MSSYALCSPVDVKKKYPLRLVFTSEAFGVGVIIRSAERYDLVKIKLTESEEEYQCRLRLHCLRSSENQIAGVVTEAKE